jgi:hypothetical protein
MIPNPLRLPAPDLLTLAPALATTPVDPTATILVLALTATPSVPVTSKVAVEAGFPTKFPVKVVCRVVAEKILLALVVVTLT